MPALPPHCNLKIISVGHAGARHDRDLTAVNIRPQVRSDDLIHPTLGMQVINQGLGTAAHFLRCLKTKIDGSRQVCLVVLEHPSCAQQHGGMPVMTAGMHHARGFGGKRQAGFLLDRQCIHVRTNRDALAFPLTARQDAHHTVIVQAFKRNAQPV